MGCIKQSLLLLFGLSFSCHASTFTPKATNSKLHKITSSSLAFGSVPIHKASSKFAFRPIQSSHAQLTKPITPLVKTCNYNSQLYLSSQDETPIKNNDMDNNDIDPEMEKGGKQGSIELGGKEFEMTIVEANEDDLSDEFWDGVEGAKPPMLMVLKQLLGINIFTYILAALIVIFLSLNALLGPGWLGQQLGFQGTGTFTEVSDSLPGVLDLNDSDNLLF